MPITINGSGTLTGISAGGLPDDSIVTADIAAGAVTTAKVADANITAAKLSGAQSGSAPIYGARAWVNFNGTGTVAIRASGNVSSITDQGVGQYTINFTTAMPDQSYSAVSTVRDDGGGQNVRIASAIAEAYTASSFRIQCTTTGNASYGDSDLVSIAVFR